jgi:DNA-binding MarR family transcriptional regulator
MKLSPQQQTLIAFLRDRTTFDGVGPSQSQIAQHLGVTLGAVPGKLDALERKGVIRRKFDTFEQVTYFVIATGTVAHSRRCGRCRAEYFVQTRDHVCVAARVEAA